MSKKLHCDLCKGVIKDPNENEYKIKHRASWFSGSDRHTSWNKIDAHDECIKKLMEAGSK